MGEAMISPDEFLRRCERVKVEFAVEGRERQQLTRELAALCALTGARAESLYDYNSQLTGLRVSDPGGDLGRRGLLITFSLIGGQCAGHRGQQLGVVERFLQEIRRPDRIQIRVHQGFLRILSSW